jgi:hypothetical protein
MNQSDTELLFPPRVIPSLLNLRGERWSGLVSRTAQLQTADRDRLAFVLLMVRLGGCTTCTADSFRAMRGCTQCACQTVRRYRGSDQDLLALFDQARQEIDRNLEAEA